MKALKQQIAVLVCFDSRLTFNSPKHHDNRSIKTAITSAEKQVKTYGKS